MADFEERPDLTSLSEDDLRREVEQTEALLRGDDRTDAGHRRRLGTYVMRLNEELGKRRGSRSGNGDSAVE